MFEAPRQIRPVTAGAGDVAIGYAPLAQIDFGQIGATLWRGRWTILSCALGGLVLALLAVALAPRAYTAVTQILIDPTDLLAVGNGTTPSTPPSDAGLLQVESQVRVLSSDAVLRRVVASQNLDQDREFAGTRSPLRVLGDDLLATIGLRRDGIADDKTLAALTELRRHLVVKRDERTYVVEVDVTTRDPAKSARIANAIAEAYLAEQTQTRADAARQVSQSLSARLQALKERVREAEERVEAYKARNNMIGANGQLISEQQLSDINNQLAAARVRTADAKARLDQIELVQRSKDENGAFPEALQSATITALRSQYAEVMRREAEQMTTLGPLHPAVIDIQAQAERLRRMIQNEVDRAAVAARTEYQSAKASERTIADTLESLKHSTIDTNAAMVGLRELERDAQASRDIYQAFLVRARETGEQERLDTKNIRVISKADLPLRRSSPPPTLLVAFGAMMLGAAGGAGIVLLRPLSQAPAQRGSGQAWRQRLGRAARDALGTSPAAARKIPVLAALPAVDVSFALDTAGDPKSEFARGIHDVYAALQADPRDRDDNPSVLIVSLHDDDDAAAAALTLAAVAAANQRVLLIDADLERRTLSAIDAAQSDAGLVDVAIGRRHLADVITRDRDTDINLVSFVSPDSRRDRRIYETDVRRVFDEAKRFGMVIVTAIGMQGDPSTRFFGALVDHIVLVARVDEDERSVDGAVARLGLDRAKVRGAILTGAGS